MDACCAYRSGHSLQFLMRIERTYVNCEAIDRRPSFSVGARRRQRRASPFMAAEFGVSPVHTGARDRSSGKLPIQFSRSLIDNAAASARPRSGNGFSLLALASTTRRVRGGAVLFRRGASS
jgi:hypothetical protein